MGGIGAYDEVAVRELLERQHGMITRSQALQRKLSRQALRHRLRLDGPWQVLLPGVYATFTGAATGTQREMAAQLYAGPGSVITGQAALAAHGVRVLDRRAVDVLIPAQRRRQDAEFVRVLRTRRMPKIVYSAGEIRYVPPARAVADAARMLSDMSDARTLVATAIQGRNVRVAELAQELAQGPAIGSARLRAALAEAAEGVRSTAEADLRALIRHSRLPAPLYNPRLYKGDEFLAIPDAWWGEAALAVEVDSREWHLSPREWEQTMARHSRMGAAGITVLHYPPRRIRREPQVVAAEIRSAPEEGRGRELRGVRAVPAS